MNTYFLFKKRSHTISDRFSSVVKNFRESRWYVMYFISLTPPCTHRGRVSMRVTQDVNRRNWKS